MRLDMGWKSGSAAVAILGISTLLGVSAARAEVPAGLTESDPVECTGAKTIRLTKRYIQASDDAVRASGSCTVWIVDSHIEARGDAVRASGNASVRIENSYVAGDSALRASGSARIVYSGSEIVGETKASGNAQINNEGGGMVTSRAGEDVSISTGGVNVGGVEISPDGVRVGGTGVSVGADGVRVGGAGGVGVTTGADGVRVQAPGATVVVDGDYVRIGAGSTVTEANVDWRSSPSDYDTRTVLIELGATEEEGEIRLNLAGDVLFDFDSADVRPDAAAQLAKVAHLLRDRSTGEITVVGHTDSKGEDAYNQQLSEKRAVSVMSWLGRSEGIPLSLMRGRGEGAKKPVAYNTMPDGSDNAAGRAQNRRVELYFATAE